MGVREQEPRARIQEPQALPDALAALTENFSDKLVRQVFRGARVRAGEATTRSKPRRIKPK